MAERKNRPVLILYKASECESDSYKAWREFAKQVIQAGESEIDEVNMAESEQDVFALHRQRRYRRIIVDESISGIHASEFKPPTELIYRLVTEKPEDMRKAVQIGASHFITSGYSVSEIHSAIFKSRLPRHHKKFI